MRAGIGDADAAVLGAYSIGIHPAAAIGRHFAVLRRFLGGERG
ncbi:hypothetical protein SAMN05519104_5435 [Rhizobiales bacterium GAS188]|nr:hypothetical protein SAMN05519104_5435 [Rhizobiales bacterium GAS188]